MHWFKLLLVYCIKLFYIFATFHCSSNEYFYTCVDKEYYDCPLVFFVIEDKSEAIDDLNSSNIKTKLIEFYQDENSLYLSSGDDNRCWKIDNQHCLFELQRYYELYNLGLLPFPFSKEKKYSNGKRIIHINMNTVSNATREICEHFTLVFALALSLKIATDNIAWPISGVVLYSAFFATYPKICKWWRERMRIYF